MRGCGNRYTVRKQAKRTSNDNTLGVRIPHPAQIKTVIMKRIIRFILRLYEGFRCPECGGRNTYSDCDGEYCDDCGWYYDDIY